MVSRLLTEARNEGVVEISIIRPIITDDQIADQIMQRFGIRNAVIFENKPQHASSNKTLGQITATTLKKYISPNMTIGIIFGKAVRDTIRAFEKDKPLNIKVLQLFGAVDSTSSSYDVRELVRELANKMGGTPYYINAPFIMKNPDTARELRENIANKGVFNLIHDCQYILAGIGSIHKQHSTFYQAGFLNDEDLRILQQQNAVGGMGGYHFDIHGNIVGQEIENRIVGITHEAILNNNIATIVTARGENKVTPILGALRTNMVHTLITDLETAKSVLSLDETLH
jgi:DNA-binding transcriptional regulator LsrR (DeoR family)